MIRRVRTGCITCRKRRIKCDEAKPGCERCHAANFCCEGYEAPRNATKSKSRSISSSPRAASSPEDTSSHSSSSPVSIISELPWRQANWRKEQLSSYHHFVTWTVVRLFRADHVSFWRDQVAQMSFGVDTVYEALLAVGAAHRASLLSHSNTNVEEVVRCKVLGFSAYGKALRLLGENMGENTTMDQSTVLIVLLLCTYFECFMDNSKGALRHLWAAIQVLNISETQLSAPELANLVPIYEAILRLDFLALKLLPYAASSFSRCSDRAIMEVPFWNRQPSNFSGIAQPDAIATERHRLMQLICGHNKLNRVIWGCWYPSHERPTRGELISFYNEMLLWKATSLATFAGYTGTYQASSIAEFDALLIPPPPLLLVSSEAAVNAIMFNGYLGCALSMISTTDEDPIAREIEAFNLVYENLRISAGLIYGDDGQASSNYMSCDTLDMGISIFLYHGARRCFSSQWQQWTLAALHAIGREGLSNAHASANTLEIMLQIESILPLNPWAQNSYDLEISPLGSIRDRLIPLLMPRGEEDQFLAYFLTYGATEAESDERHVRIVGRATWKQDTSGNIRSLEIDTYNSKDTKANSLPDDAGNMTIFSSWRQSVERGWHGFLTAEEVAL